MTAVPKELRDRPQWVGWRLEQRDGKTTKVPCSAKTGAPADVTNPATWATFSQATQAAKRGALAGIGYAFSPDDPYTGVDFDKVRDPASGTLDPVAAEIVARLSSYTEVSQSGLGVHVIVRAKLPGTRHRTKLVGAQRDDAGIEMYDSGRFFVMTGDHLPGTPTTIEDRHGEVAALYVDVFPERSDQTGAAPTGTFGNGLTDDAVLARMLTSKTGERIQRLWDGETTVGDGSSSAADLALCSYLAYWTNRDAAKMDQLFRQSKLMRDKWDSPRGDSTYGADTIARAIAGTRDGYNPNASSAQSGDSADQQSSTAAPWPEPLSEAAYQGLVGEFVRLIEPQSESDPAALLLQFLIAVGNAFGDDAYFPVERTQHHTNLYGVLVGATAKSRKGTALHHSVHVLRWADINWANNCIASGLSTGEGLIHRVRDPIIKSEPIRDKSKAIIEYQDVQVDPGVADKRLLAIQPEFAAVLSVMGRESSTLSEVLRQAWDGDVLQTMTKNSAEKATGAHISLIGHITVEELRRKITDTELANGFANRISFFCVARSRSLPDGGVVDEQQLAVIKDRVAEALRWVKSKGTAELARDAAARAIWHEAYEQMSAGQPGLLGSIISRAEALVLRFSMVYALLDRSTTIRPEHLNAAIEVWRYAEDSAKHIWGESLGYPDAEMALAAIQQGPGINRARLYSLFGGNNRSGARLDAALSHLVSRGLVYRTFDKGEGQSGRPPERWYPRVGGSDPFLSTGEGMKNGGDGQKTRRGRERNAEEKEKKERKSLFMNELTRPPSTSVERKGNKPPPSERAERPVKDQEGARSDCPRCSFRQPCATHESAY